MQDQYIEDGVEWEYIPVQTNDVLIEAFQQVAWPACLTIVVQ